MVAEWEWGLISLCALGKGFDERAWTGGPGCRSPHARGTSCNELIYTVDYITRHYVPLGNEDGGLPWAMAWLLCTMESITVLAVGHCV